MISCQEPLRGMLTLIFKKFGMFGALAIAVGILGAPYFRNFGSPKIRKNGSAPWMPLLFHAAVDLFAPGLPVLGSQTKPLLTAGLSLRGRDGVS